MTPLLKVIGGGYFNITVPVTVIPAQVAPRGAFGEIHDAAGNLIKTPLANPHMPPEVGEAPNDATAKAVNTNLPCKAQERVKCAGDSNDPPLRCCMNGVCVSCQGSPN